MNIRTQNDYSSDINGRHTLNMRRSVAGGSDSGTLIQGFNGIFGYSGSSRNNYLNHAMTYLDTPSYSLGDAIVYKFLLPVIRPIIMQEFTLVVLVGLEVQLQYLR